MLTAFGVDYLFKFVSRAIIQLSRAKVRQAGLDIIIKDWAS